MSLKITTLDTEYIIENKSVALAVARPSGAMRRLEAAKVPALTTGTGSAKSQWIVGILGLVTLPHSKYLVVATQSRPYGSIGTAGVERVSDTALLPLSASSINGNPDQRYLDLLRSHLKSATLLFSTTYDLTSSAQRAARLTALGLPTLDDRFMWNFRISAALLPFPEFVFPVIYGVFSGASLEVNGHSIQFAVLSRRSRFRAGTRYFRRGIDVDGNVANFNETEQLLMVGSRVFSYLQTRGSVPAVWSEVNNLRYKPKLRIGSLDESVIAAQRHFIDQKERYGHQYLVNLVNSSGYERPVKEAYEAVVERLKDPALAYIYFDFHHECSKMRWHRVQLLVDELRAQGLDETMYFESDGLRVVQEQTGIVRTNCMDCLDRTNVVQSTLALYQLERQLEVAGVLANGATIASDPAFVTLFRNTWADNADGVSKAYSGTGALKTDFTRTGKRTKLGALSDLRNSIVRYYRNNLADGPRQDAYSLFLEDLPEASARASPLADPRPLTVQALPYISGSCALIAFLITFWPSEKHSAGFNAVVAFLFAAIALVSLQQVFAHGLQYVNWPRLTPVRFVHWTEKNGYQIAGEHQSSKEE